MPGHGPTVARQRIQPTTAGKAPSHARAQTSPGGASVPANRTQVAHNSVAPAPQLAAVQAEAITAALASSAASAQALGFYRIPLFLLPIYKAAGARYGVPWQVLAAINEVETNYGADLSISTAGAVGWMQFIPATWLSYGVDALDAGYADPYNPVDAIFAAARYLRAAGAANDLRAAVFAYNHSAAYVASVLLRARLIATYPRDVIATLTGLASARLPVAGAHVGWEREQVRVRAPKRRSSPRPVVVTSAPDALAVAVQDGRIVRLGRSRALGRFVVLQDVYGDEFTYSGLGSIAASHARQGAAAVRQPALDASRAVVSTSARPRGDKVRLFAHPGNLDARAIGAGRTRRATGRAALQLHPGVLVSAGTELGRVDVPAGAHLGSIRFAIRPAGDPGTIDPRPVLAGWAQLDSALHPRGAMAQQPLAGATASDALALTRAQLERATLSDPGVDLDACSRHEITSGRLDRRVLAVIAFLSRSGLHPTVRALGCRPGETKSRSAARVLGTVDLVAVNGVAIVRHQRAGTIVDRTIRTLLRIPSPCAPQAIWSLMRYAGDRRAHAASWYWNRIRVTFPQRPSCSASPQSAMTLDLQSARTVQRARRWEQLIARIAALPVPTVATKPSAAAIPEAPAVRAVAPAESPPRPGISGLQGHR